MKDLVAGLGIPDYQSLMLPVLEASADGEVKVQHVIEQLARRLGMSEAERAALLPSGRQTVFANRVHWAKTYLVKAGLVEATRRGFFRITGRGREVMAAGPARIDNDFLTRFEEFCNFYNGVGPKGGISQADTLPDATAQTPDEEMRDAHRKIEAALAEDLLDRVRAAPPAFFERLIVTLLLAMGYGGPRAEAGEVLGRSGDGGVDGVIHQDELGLDRVYVQAKRYAKGNGVGPDAIRSFSGSLGCHKADKGVFVTTSHFTSDARAVADSATQRIILLDGDELARLMIRYNVGCRVEESLHIRKIDEGFFDPAE